ncbi:TetR/AcrR family transcriptional regulator [Nocardia takedensis]|uniref:TetR/AcrR family transcriptional regulator n=1 Tax=Nocardia takedensis TaxID=259390 RepID=UPI003F75CA4B
MTTSGKPVPTRTEQQHATRERLVGAAVELFFVGGFGSSSLDEIAARAGYTHGAIDAHFDSKVDLGATVLDEVYRGVIERLGLVRVDTADQLVSVVSTWVFLAVTRSGWIPLESSLTESTPERAIPLTRLVAALGDWLTAAAERIGAPSTDDCEVTVSLLVCVLAGLVTQHPDPADITIAMVRSYVELALSTIAGPRRIGSPPPPALERSPNRPPGAPASHFSSRGR